MPKGASAVILVMIVKQPIKCTLSILVSKLVFGQTTSYLVF